MKVKTISQKFQKSLALIVAAALAASTLFVFILNSNISRKNYEDIISTTLDDIEKDIADTSDINMLGVSNIKAYKQLKKLINAEHYDLIICNTPMGGIVTRLAAKKTRKNGTKVIYMVHGFHFYKGASKLNWMIYYPIERYMARHCDVLITINEEDYALARAKFKNVKVEHIHGVGVCEERYHPATAEERAQMRKAEGIGENDFAILCTGELNANKDQKTLVSAAAKLKDKIPGLKILLAGNGPTENELRELVCSLGLEDTVKMLGYRTDLENVVPAMDLIDNSELITLVSKQAPDLIFITGDMINKNETDLSGICSLVSALKEIAPVYYSYGNSENEWMSKNTEDLSEALTDAGARVLELSYDDVTVNGQELRIGGYAGYYRTPVMDTASEEKRTEMLAFSDDFENTDRQKLLLAHIATSWTDWGRIDLHPVGVVFCGHYHGGQVRFPIIDRGLYAPYVGWFPKYTKGVFYGDCATCVLSAGLGSDERIPRIYDPPEIVVADLVPNK